jgi:hypothetical protein
MAMYLRTVSLLSVLALLTGLVAIVATTAAADHTPDPVSVAIAGNLQDELGCAGDWQADCAATDLAFDADDDVWQGTFNVPPGTWEYKTPLNDSWTENYGAGAVANGANIALSLGAATDVKFFFDSFGSSATLFGWRQ